jgi:heavy metal sensor kinase
MNFASIRVRLAGWYLAVLVSAVLLLGVGVWIALRYELYRALDDSLSEGTAGLAQFLERESDGDDLPSILQEAHEYTSGLPAGHRLRLFGPDHSVLLSFPDTPTAVSMFQKTEDVVVRGHPLRIELSAPTQQIDATLSSLRNILLGCIPIVLLAAALGGWWLSRTALQPVDRMTGTAESISLNDLSARLIVPRTGDELERFGEAWNRMLDRLSISVEKMRRFTADAAHELRTPIAIIRSTAELALRRERDPDAYRTALANIGEEARSLSDLVADLLWLARNDAGFLKYNFEDIPIGEFIIGACRSLQSLALAQDVSLKADIKVAAECSIHADRSALRRVVLILADNAIKFARPGGTVDVRVLRRAGDCLVEVWDDGVGISAEDLPFIFDRFYTSDRARNNSGSGLGLSIAKAIVEPHHGHIEVESATGAGSCFRVVLPLNVPNESLIGEPAPSSARSFGLPDQFSSDKI